MDTTDLLYIEQCSEDYTNRMHFKFVERSHCWQTGPSLADTIRVLFLRKNLVNSTNKDGQSVFHTPKIFRLILCTVFLLSTSDTFEERKISPYIRITPYYWRKMKDGFFRGKIFIVCLVNKIFCIIKITLEYIRKNFFLLLVLRIKFYIICI